jgi:hypothetical protein
MWSAEEIEAAVTLARRWGMGEHSVRELFQRRLVQTWGEREGVGWQLELCVSGEGAYVRLIAQLEAGLGQEIRLLREGQAGAIAAIWKMREVVVGDRIVDDKLVLFAKDEARLKALLGTPLRREVLDLADRVEVMEVGDHGLFVYVGRLLSLDELGALLQSSVSVMERLAALSKAWGPLTDRAELPSYEDAIGNEFKREGDSTRPGTLEVIAAEQASAEQETTT